MGYGLIIVCSANAEIVYLSCEELSFPQLSAQIRDVEVKSFNYATVIIISLLYLYFILSVSQFHSLNALCVCDII